MNNTKICAIVVTYNRKKILEKNIDALLQQTVEFDILIVDNCSTDGTDEFIRKKYNNPKIMYYKLESNIGGAGGFYSGMKKAMELQYDLVILMDDDGKPADKVCFENLLNVYYSENNCYTIVNSLVLCDLEKNKLSFDFYKKSTLDEITNYIVNNKIENEIKPFNGTLISKEVIQKIGYPIKEFFIGGDENEYIFHRARKNNCNLVTAVESRYYHPRPVRIKKKILFKTVELLPLPLWRVYYDSRNSIYIQKKYYPKFNYYTYSLKLIIKNLLLSEHPLRRTKYIIKGLKDGKKQKINNTMHLKQELQEKC